MSSPVTPTAYPRFHEDAHDECDKPFRRYRGPATRPHQRGTGGAARRPTSRVTGAAATPASGRIRRTDTPASPRSDRRAADPRKPHRLILRLAGPVRPATGTPRDRHTTGPPCR